MRSLLILSIHLALVLWCVVPLNAQEVPFNRGINLTSWFQATSPQQIQLNKYTQQDFQNIKSLGCDVIRLPINLHAMAGGAPNYTLDPLFLEFLDHAVDLAESMEIYLILDNHTFDPAVGTDPNIGAILESVWEQMAEHYKNRSQYVIYEVLNEPHDISDQQWNSIQQNVVDVIRSVDQDHFIVIGPAGWNSFHNLDAMPVYTQDKLIYTFHFYDPFVFTHQGATWSDPSLAPLSQVPFPYAAAEMPSFPPSLVGTWIQSAFNNYSNEGTASSVQAMIDIAVQFRDSRNVPIYCGEFGAYIPNSDPADRVFYYKTVQEYLAANQIPWTMWDYHGGFGMFEEDGNDLFEHDLNLPLLESLGLNIPAQTPFVIQPETTGFALYTDQIGERIQESSSGDIKINFYSQDNPNNDKYCLRWEGGPQYQYIGFDIKPDKDLTTLVSEDYALDFLFRSTEPVAFDIRFMDSDGEDLADRPWRMGYTIDESVVVFDSRWHHLHIPLSVFQEQGAWEGQWYPPEGKFDWSEVDRLEIVAEHADMGNARFWFDNMFVTNLDTAQVHDDSVFEDLVTSTDESDYINSLRLYPNPVSSVLVIESTSASASASSNSRSRTSASSSFSILDNMGRVLLSDDFKNSTEVNLSTLPSGLYLVQVTGHGDHPITKRIIKF